MNKRKRKKYLLKNCGISGPVFRAMNKGFLIDGIRWKLEYSSETEGVVIRPGVSYNLKYTGENSSGIKYFGVGSEVRGLDEPST